MRSRYSLLLLAVPLLVIGCFFLPNMASALSDANTLDNLTIVDSRSVSFDAVPELGLPERISLIANPNTEGLTLKTGKTITDPKAAGAHASAELESFVKGYGIDFSAEDYILESSSAGFIVDSENPSISIITWELIIYDRNGASFVVTIDDETGKIIKLIYRDAAGNAVLPREPASEIIIKSKGYDDSFREDAQRLAGMMTDYYGRSVVISKYELIGSIGYYTAEMANGAAPVVMYGVIRENSFTMNEKPSTR